MKGFGAVIGSLSLFLIYAILLSLPGFPREGVGPGPGGGSVVSGRNGETGKVPEKNTGSGPGMRDHLCPFKYPVYFFWFVFAAISASVLFVADMTTGWSMDLVKRFIPWAKFKTGELDRCFREKGCP